MTVRTCPLGCHRQQVSHVDASGRVTTVTASGWCLKAKQKTDARGWTYIEASTECALMQAPAPAVAPRVVEYPGAA